LARLFIAIDLPADAAAVKSTDLPRFIASAVTQLT
jgi:hypothetical protein